MIILCSPGNPTGTTIPLSTIESILSNSKFNGILVVDEAYIDFAGMDKSAIKLVRQGWENLIVTHTLSKGFGLAGLRYFYIHSPGLKLKLVQAYRTYAPLFFIMFA